MLHLGFHKQRIYHTNVCQHIFCIRIISESCTKLRPPLLSSKILSILTKCLPYIYFHSAFFSAENRFVFSNGLIECLENEMLDYPRNVYVFMIKFPLVSFTSILDNSRGLIITRSR